MNARDIPECINPLKALRIDKVWFRAFTEMQLESKIKDFIESTDYDYYILVSDDTIVTQAALDNLLKHQTEAEVVTGWCNIFPLTLLAAMELSPIISNRDSLYLLVRDRIPRRLVPFVKWSWRNTPIRKPINWALYKHFPNLDEIWAKEEVFQCYFVQWALSSLTRKTWIKYGFHYGSTDYAGHGSDQAMSVSLGLDGVKILCARDSFIYHLASVRHMLVGKVTPEVIFEPMPIAVTAWEHSE